MTTQSITDDFDHENLFLTHRLNDGERDWRDIPNMALDSLSFGDACWSLVHSESPEDADAQLGMLETLAGDLNYISEEVLDRIAWLKAQTVEEKRK